MSNFIQRLRTLDCTKEYSWIFDLFKKITALYTNKCLWRLCTFTYTKSFKTYWPTWNFQLYVDGEPAAGVGVNYKCETDAFSALRLHALVA